MRNGANALSVHSHIKVQLSQPSLQTKMINKLILPLQRNFTGKNLVDWIITQYKADVADRKMGRCICEYLQINKNLFYNPKFAFRDGENSLFPPSTICLILLGEDDTVFSFTSPKRVVVIGGGFGGSYVSKLLDKEGSYKVTLISTQPYFECIPSFPFIIGRPDYPDKIRAPHKKVFFFHCFFPPFSKLIMETKVSLQNISNPQVSHRSARKIRRFGRRQYFGVIYFSFFIFFFLLRIDDY